MIFCLSSLWNMIFIMPISFQKRYFEKKVEISFNNLLHWRKSTNITTSLSRTIQKILEFPKSTWQIYFLNTFGSNFNISKEIDVPSKIFHLSLNKTITSGFPFFQEKLKWGILMYDIIVEITPSLHISATGLKSLHTRKYYSYVNFSWKSSLFLNNHFKANDQSCLFVKVCSNIEQIFSGQ